MAENKVYGEESVLKQIKKMPLSVIQRVRSNQEASC